MNLKQKIKYLIKEKKPNDTLLQEVSKIKVKLTNTSNIDYEAYNKLSDIEHSLYRYNNFLKNGMQNYAETEAKNLMNLSDENSTVLEGGISNIKYIWRTEPNACEKCQELDGTEYNSKEDIPQKPHPNCKCYIEEVKDDDEMCDCSKFIQKINEILNEIEKLREVITIQSSNITQQLYYSLSIELENVGQSLLEEYSQYDNLLGDLASSFVESRENIFENSDKYYHMKAYCKVGQRENEIDSMIGLGAGKFRELLQGVISVITREKSFTEAVKEYHEDMNANKKGHELGRNFPTTDCEDIIKTFWSKEIWK